MAFKKKTVSTGTSVGHAVYSICNKVPKDLLCDHVTEDDGTVRFNSVSMNAANQVVGSETVVPQVPPVEIYAAFDDDPPEGAESPPTGPLLAEKPPLWEPSTDQQVAYDGLMDWYGSGCSPQVMTVGGYAGCLSGDTIVEYSRSEDTNLQQITLADLYLKFNGYRVKGQEAAQRWDTDIGTFMHSLFPDGTVKRNKVLAIFKSGVKSVVRVQLSDGASLVLTKDHPVAIPGGEFIEAGEVHPGDVLLARGSMKELSATGRKPVSMRPPRIVVNTQFHPGHKHVVESDGKRSEYVLVARARLVVEADINGVNYDDFLMILRNDPVTSAEFQYLDRNVDVRHLDGDPLNDIKENLEVITQSGHTNNLAQEVVFSLDYTRKVFVISVQEAGEQETYDVQMLPPANNFVADGVFVHNTGKTRLTGKLAYDLLSRDEVVAFATPTGKAAQVLRKSMIDAGVLEPPVSTVHSLIYIPEVDLKTGRVIGWMRRRSLDVNLIVLDEASMVSQKMLNDLRAFRVPILAVGDHGQLPPVGEEASLMKDPHFKLEKIHRQAKGNPIIRLSTLVRNGCPDHLIKKYIEDVNDERLMWTTSKRQAREFAKPPGMLLCYTNRLRTSINHDVREDIMGYDEEYDPMPGEVVICLKNQRLDDSGQRMIANGMRGTIVSCVEGGKHTYKMTVEFDEPVGVVENLYVSKWQFLQEKTFKGFDEVPGDHNSWWSVGALFDFGYALTCHKAQGSQAEHVAVFMESWLLSRLDDDDRRRWIYTACTRSSHKLMLVF